MLPKWIVIPLLLAAITISVLAVYGGKRYSNYYLSPLASSPQSINGLKRTWYFCTKCLNGEKCEAEDIRQCKTVTFPDRNDALDVAVGTANIEAVYFLVNIAKTDVNGVSGYFQQPPLMAAAYYGTEQHQKIASFLISHGANINATDLTGSYTALLKAIWKNNIEFAKFLLENGANPNQLSPHIRARSACTSAIVYGRKEIIPYIPNCCSIAKNSPEFISGPIFECE
ncbi:ankyrin repeat domain-containing protein [Buttiauxella izardii]|uniref:Ankyrin repeat domain-containing protein n=1 Tax=Buttiauxella izardii TaxID=82991 RepID=A0A3A5JYG2_9ENTR|nr:ankyrin repeat domain-containing protein [Buttiauxella izardii]RJT19424.1 ankyrin repeat domain-containing protein [Buttiauxella izardii]